LERPGPAGPCHRRVIMIRFLPGSCC
jgi:hypothetical protein